MSETLTLRLSIGGRGQRAFSEMYNRDTDTKMQFRKHRNTQRVNVSCLCDANRTLVITVLGASE